ncbi:MAG TPA: hypothetical protein VKB38_13140 [Terracidiphilus sp.]|nr:hypothetical protein [Terracidiphilus sp.]
MTIADIVERMKGQPSPHDLANYKVYLAAEYAYLSGQLDASLMVKPEKWEAFRLTCTSDTQAERKWARTPEGVQETSIRLKLKSIEKMMSAISTKISVATEEARNNF